MKKLVAIFAHPDDEAFGPGGTIAKLSHEHEITVICVTPGDAGQNVKNGEVRKEELRKSAKILGVKRVLFLDFRDGALCNNLYHQLAKELERELVAIKPELLMTFDSNGVSGHIDHITVSMVTTYVFYRLPFVKKLLYYCLELECSRLYKDYFIHFPDGYRRSDIDEVVDITDYWETKIAAMMAHESQRFDAQRVLSKTSHLPKEECFLVIEK